MEEKLYKIMDGLSEEELARFEEPLCAAADTSRISQSDKKRILALTARKAGFEMKKTNTRTLGKKRIIAFAAAAALVFTGAIGSYAAYSSYSKKMYSAVENRFSDSVTDSQIENLHSVTKAFDGTVLENTFEELDFTFEGIISDATEQYVVFTAAKKDGTPFVAEEGYSYICGYDLSQEKPICDIGLEVNRWDGLFTQIKVADDGTLLISIDNFFSGDTREGENTSVLGIDGIYKIKGELPEKLFNKRRESTTKLLEYSEETADGSDEAKENYDKLRSEILGEISEYAEESYDGIFKFEVTFDGLGSIHIFNEDYGCDIYLSSISLFIEDKNSWSLCPDAGKQEVTVEFADGTSTTVIAKSGHGESRSYDDSTGEYTESKNSFVDIDFSEPIDPLRVTEIKVNGMTFEIN